MSSPTAVGVEVRDRIATLTVHRPAAHNALDRTVQQALDAQLDAVAADPAVAAVVLTGEGSRAFAAGADVKQLRDYTRDDGLAGRLQALLGRLESFEKPTVAAVNGLALGGGCELALACDLRIASSSARFGFPETGLGVLPGAGGTQRLGRLIGFGRAMDLVLTGRLIGADEARSYGLVTHVVEPDDLPGAARRLATTIAGKGPLATRLARLALRAAADTDLRTGQTIERLAQALLHETTDKQEGIAALLEGRDARFEGR